MVLVAGCHSRALDEEGLTNDQPMSSGAIAYRLNSGTLANGLAKGLGRAFGRDGSTHPVVASVMLNPVDPPPPDLDAIELLALQRAGLSDEDIESLRCQPGPGQVCLDLRHVFNEGATIRYGEREFGMLSGTFNLCSPVLATWLSDVAPGDGPICDALFGEMATELQGYERIFDVRAPLTLDVRLGTTPHVGRVMRDGASVGVGVVIPLAADVRNGMALTVRCDCDNPENHSVPECNEACSSVAAQAWWYGTWYVHDVINSFSGTVYVGGIDLELGMIPSAGVEDRVKWPTSYPMAELFRVDTRLGERAVRAFIGQGIDVDCDQAADFFSRGDCVLIAQQKARLVLEERGVEAKLKTAVSKAVAEALAGRLESLLNRHEPVDKLADNLAVSMTQQIYKWFYEPFGPFEYVYPDSKRTEERYMPLLNIRTREANQSESGEIVFEVDPDPDDDGVLFNVDHCPADGRKDLRYPTNDNRDGDDRGSDCDPCPDDYGTAADNWGDSDLDGVCNSLDACPRVPNLATDNTNLLSETVHRPDRIWPDACDPVPSPRTVPLTAVSLQAGSPPCAGIGGGWCENYSLYAADNSELDVQPLGSHSPSSAGGYGLTKVPAVPTSFRFCQDRVWDDDPDCGSTTNVADRFLLQALTLEEEKRTHPYHRITVVSLPTRWLGVETDRQPHYAERGGAQYTYPTAFTLGASYPLDYDRSAHADVRNPPPRRFQWYYEQDYWRWKGEAVPRVPVDGRSDVAMDDERHSSHFVNLETFADLYQEKRLGLLSGLGPRQPLGPEALHGRLWLHADTTVGEALHGKELANTHLDYRPVVMDGYYQWSFGGYAKLDRFPLDDPRRPFDDPRRWVVEWPEFSANPTWDAALGQPIALFSTPLGLAALDGKTGTFRPADGLLEPRLSERLLDPNTVVVSQAEPFTMAATGAIAGVALSADGTEFRDVVAFDSGRLVGLNSLLLDRMLDPEAESFTAENAFIRNLQFMSAQPALTRIAETAVSPVQRFMSFGVDEAPGSSVEATVAELGPTAAPTPRQGHRAVYSGQLNRLFVIGGTEGGAAPAASVLSGSPGERLAPLTGGLGLGALRAATFEPKTRSLFVLDELSARFVKWARLSKIDAVTGATRELGRWPVLGLFERQYLVADHDGALLLAATSPSRHRHLLLRLDATTLKLKALALREGHLPRAPIVRGDGYQRVLVGGDGRLTVDAAPELFSKEEKRLGRVLETLGGCF